MYGTEIEVEYEWELKRGMRARPVMKVAAISLALCAKISWIGDARVRNHTEICALAKFQHLVEQLAGLALVDS